MDGPKDPWPRVLSLPGRFAGTRQYITLYAMFDTKSTFYNINDIESYVKLTGGGESSGLQVVALNLDYYEIIL